MSCEQAAAVDTPQRALEGTDVSQSPEFYNSSFVCQHMESKTSNGGRALPSAGVTRAQIDDISYNPHQQTLRIPCVDSHVQ